MGLLKGLLSAGGAVVGGMVGGPAGAKIGASIGGAVGGAVSSSGGSKAATKAQLAALQEARQVGGQAYQDVRDVQSPYLGFGGGAVNALSGRLGIAPTALPATNIAKTPGSVNALSGQATGTGGPSPVIDMARQPDGSFAVAPASTSPAPPVAGTVSPAGGNALTMGTDPGTYGTTANPTAPTPYASPERPGAFTFSAADLEKTPGYQWQQDQARKSILASAGATGALQSGAALKELQDRAQQIAYQTFDRERNFAYGVNRDQRTDFNTDRGFDYGLTRDARADYTADRDYLTGRFDNQTNNLFRAAGVGQGAANTVSNAATWYGDQVAGLVQTGGEARAANALTQGQIGSDLSTGLGGLISGFIGGGQTASRAATPDINGLGQVNYGNSLRLPSVRY